MMKRIFGKILVNLLGILLLNLVFSGCEPKTLMSKVDYPQKTTVKLVKSRCHNGVCPCLSRTAIPNKEKDIAPGYKRFEFRLPQTVSEMWVSVGDQGVFYKSAKHVEPVCFYMDLMPRSYSIVVKGKRHHEQIGLQMGLEISEYAEPKDGGPSWYRSFHYTCGIGASTCSIDEMQIWHDKQEALPRGVLDYCGSVMIKKSQYAGSKLHRDDPIYQDLALRFLMKVYHFKPYLPPRSPKCKKPNKNKG